MHVHSKICNLLETQLNIGREMSTAAFLDAILYAHQRGDFSKKVQNKLNNVLSRMIARRWMRDMPPWVEANLRAVLNHDFVWPDRIRTMIQDRSGLPKQLFYPDLDPERAWDIRLKIMVTENFDEASQICNSFHRKSNIPIFIGVETAYETLRHGDKTALIAFYNLSNKQILLWRVHTYSRSEMDNVKVVISRLGRNRRFVSFGYLSFFDHVRVQNVRFNKDESLKAHCLHIGLEIKDTESHSDWTAEQLRSDQIDHASFNVIVLNWIRQFYKSSTYCEFVGISTISMVSFFRTGKQNMIIYVLAFTVLATLYSTSKRKY
ncbi:unnamed protein product [Caenorhabditis nigoni]